MSADTQVNVAGRLAGAETSAGQASCPKAGLCTAVQAIAQRELASLFYQPIAYVVGFIFLALTGFFFMDETLVPGQEASLRFLFERMAGVLVFALPLLTMRSIAEDFAGGTIETLMTAPVSETAVVLGKFFGTLVFYLLLLAATLFHAALLGKYADPVGSVVLSGYLGMVLLGGLFIAVGIFASSCTRHQLLAAILAIAVLAFFTFVVDYAAEYAGSVKLREVCAYANVLWQFDEFAKGFIDVASVVFFVSGIAFFLFLATKVMESRRWR